MATRRWMTLVVGAGFLAVALTVLGAHETISDEAPATRSPTTSGLAGPSGSAPTAGKGRGAGEAGSPTTRRTGSPSSGPTVVTRGPRLVDDTDYPIPANSVIVAAVGGSDRGDGSTAHPFATVARAVSEVPDGGTIVLRGGSYRESLGVISKRVTIQAWPHEAPLLDGRTVVGGFVRAAGRWQAPFRSPLCQTCYDAQTVGAQNPEAGSPDMAFLDGAPMRQVGSPGALGPGRFYVDRQAGTLDLGDDPIGHQVQASVLASAMTLDGDGSMLRGVGVIGYGSTEDRSAPAMVVVRAAGVTVEHVTFASSASRGLTLYGSGARVQSSHFRDNGLAGIQAYRADQLRIVANTVQGSNAAGFDTTAQTVLEAAGIKVATSVDVVISDNDVHDNVGNGIWCDLACARVSVVRNRVTGNALNGVFIELGSQTVVASNAVAGNATAGVAVLDSRAVWVWNNTVAGSGQTVLLVADDGRTPPGLSATQAAGWHTSQVSVGNDVVVATGSGAAPLLGVRDFDASRQLTISDMVSSLDRDAYQGPRSTAVVRLSSGDRVCAALADLQRAAPVEAAGIASASPVLVDPARGDLRVVTGGPADAPGRSLPAEVAAALGRAPDGVRLGAIVAPGI